MSPKKVLSTGHKHWQTNTRTLISFAKPNNLSRSLFRSILVLWIHTYSRHNHLTIYNIEPKKDTTSTYKKDLNVQSGREPEIWRLTEGVKELEENPQEKGIRWWCFMRAFHWYWCRRGNNIFLPWKPTFKANQNIISRKQKETLNCTKEYLWVLDC